VVPRNLDNEAGEAFKMDDNLRLNAHTKEEEDIIRRRSHPRANGSFVFCAQTCFVQIPGFRNRSSNRLLDHTRQQFCLI
jgi:hypothetical protein